MEAAVTKNFNSAVKNFKKATTAVVGGIKVAQTGANQVKNVVGETTFTVADSLGLTSTIEAADKAARRAVKDGGKKLADANKAVHKARRLANRALDLEEDDSESIDSADYDLLLSAAGATEKTIGINTSHNQTFMIPAGSAFAWKVRVKKHDIGFAVRETRDGGVVTDIEIMTKYRSDAPIQGQLTASNYSRNVTLVFDNTHSHLQAKRCVYWVACGENVTLADDAVGAARSLEVQAAEEGPSE